ncbi:MAG: asparagine synthase (glutamine-hydrolyzing) [Sphingomonadaceae bacterium]|nr:asparagine synthase (glutamine-hydrolyzing) [Sphingomonadaceae bacterium]
MCGIAGILANGRADAALVARMTGSLRHRGPDGEGVWTDTAAGIGLGHRRLAVIDLSAAGDQPMHSHSGRHVISFNGEIYNHRALRAALAAEGAGEWRGHSDTETLLEAIEAWGLERTLQRCAGMFAFALWDRRERALFLARDRFGEKPLYYGRIGGEFLFASELKALRLHSRFDAEIDRDALAALAARGYVPAPLSIFRGIFKLPPASILRVDQAGEQLSSYWSYRAVVERGLAEPLSDEAAAREALEAALAAAIAEQSIADVPVGTFLSGGIDSSSIVALWQLHGTRPLRTYAIGFEEQGFDEAPHARAVARHFGTEHREHYVGSAEARDVIPLLPAIYDEPFADPSQIPTWLLSRLAREEVTVAVSGDGGDELLGGYTRYRTAARLWQAMARTPPVVRHVAGAALGRVPARAWEGLATLMPRRPAYPSARLRRTFHRLRSVGSAAALYGSFRDEWTGEASPVVGAPADGAGRTFDFEVGGAPDLVRMMYCDAVSYLPDDILCKVDRAAMAHGLEVRIPFLDHRVAAVAARIPASLKVRDGTGKYILRQLLFGHAPAHLFDRPKTGFSVPIGAWLKGPLKPWAEALLEPARLDREGFFDGAAIARRWREHLAGRRDATFSLWPVLMFQAWNAAR